MKTKFLLISILVLSSVALFSQEAESGRSNTATAAKVVPDIKKIPAETTVPFVSDKDEPGNFKDQLINDDLIVTGSVGVGFDMTIDYDFGYNTFVLKENNLRMLFDDTSSSGTFPSNDWAIELNSTVDGGENYFAIQDATAARYPFKIMAGARNNSLYISNNGKIGLGTAIPVLKLHLLNNDTPGMRLEQDGSGGWAPQTWDVAGNETNFFIRDATNGSQLPFRIQPGAPTSSLTIKSTGNVGIGTWAPEEILDVKGNIKLDRAIRFTPIIWDVASPAQKGDLYMDETDSLLKLYNGTEWLAWQQTQHLNFSNDTLSLSGSDSLIIFSSFMDNTDEQSLSINNNVLSISGSDATVDLSSLLDNTDQQTLSLTGTVLSISNGNQVDLAPILVDHQNQIDELKQSLKELQDMVIALGIKENPNTTKRASLDQNNPNPFTNYTAIDFNIDQDVQNAYILIYTEKGQLVEKIRLDKRGAGSYTYVNKEENSSILLYTLIADGVKIDTKKMMVAL